MSDLVYTEWLIVSAFVIIVGKHYCKGTNLVKNLLPKLCSFLIISMLSGFGFSVSSNDDSPSDYWDFPNSQRWIGDSAEGNIDYCKKKSRRWTVPLLGFDINKFSKFKDKIIYNVIDKQPDNIETMDKNDDIHTKGRKLIHNSIKRENYQREMAKNSLDKFADEDIILINDIDEIPNLKEINFTIVILFCYNISSPW